MTENKLPNLVKLFDICEDENATAVEPYGNGHINSTFIVNGKKKYILQKINTNVFPNPIELMNNIDLVTAHIKKKLAEEGEDTERGTLTVIKTKDGKNYAEDCGEYYRMFGFIDGVSHDNTTDPSQLFRAASVYGKFQKMLSDFPAEKLFEVIPKFHDTPSRLLNLEKAIAEDKKGRLKDVKADVEFAISYKNDISCVTSGIADGSIPLRVTHNDTKLNNFLFDKTTDECLCLIDLDTIMPGSLLYDFGDALRLGASSAAEDEADLSKVNFVFEPFEQFSRGFVLGMDGKMTKREIELLPYSELLMTYEVGIRFLTDYLEGDTYFRIAYPEHNLVRARNQLMLVRRLEENMNKLNKFIESII